MTLLPFSSLLPLVKAHPRAMASDMDSGKPPSGVAIDQACPKQCHCHRSGSLHATKVALELIVVWINLILGSNGVVRPHLGSGGNVQAYPSVYGEFTGYCCDFMWSGQTGQGLPVRPAVIERSDRPARGDSMSRKSICGDGPGVGLGIRRRPLWSEIMRDT
uniref:Uncharacterized protein n=1 Tax=Oryza sativa subsp. japonica TaxID=39947 RepID=Q8S7K4_ORYSJ|nr:Hypothetical protein [Oryza sativa Japonica Group]